MKRYLTLLFVLCSGILSAQDYQQICRPGITFFKGTDGYFKAFRRDSVAPAGNNDTLFFSYPAVRDSTGFSAFVCRDTTAGDALGIKVLKQHDGWFRFFNRTHDTLSINTQAAVNDSWRYCTLGGGNYLLATVTAILTDSVINTTDLVKVISLQAKNSAGGNISGIFNGKSIKLSKHYGLTRLFDVYRTPADTAELTLAASTIPPMGPQPFGWQEVYDFQVGDEFHYHILDTYGSIGMESKVIKTVVSKTVYGNNDSVHYSVERCTKSWYPMPPPNTQTSHDTVTLSFNFHALAEDPSVSLLPDEFLHVTFFSTNDVLPLAARKGEVYNNRLVQQFNSQGLYYNGTCYNDPFEVYGPEYWYSSGLGCTLVYRLEADINVHQYREELVYFRKGTETWGTPVAGNCDALLTGTKEISPEQGMAVYPNPAISEIRVSIQPAVKPGKYTLTDLSGRQVSGGKVAGNSFVIQRNQLAGGIYLLIVTDADGRMVSRSKVVFE